MCASVDDSRVCRFCRRVEYISRLLISISIYEIDPFCSASCHDVVRRKQNSSLTESNSSGGITDIRNRFSSTPACSVEYRWWTFRRTLFSVAHDFRTCLTTFRILSANSFGIFRVPPRDWLCAGIVRIRGGLWWGQDLPNLLFVANFVRPGTSSLANFR